MLETTSFSDLNLEDDKKINPDYDDEDLEENYDVDDIDEEEDEDDEPTETFTTRVNMNPPSSFQTSRPQYPFGGNSATPTPNLAGTSGSSFYRPTTQTSPSFQNPLTGSPYRAQPTHTPYYPPGSPYGNNSSFGSSFGGSSFGYNNGSYGNQWNGGQSSLFGNTGRTVPIGDRRALPRHSKIVFCELDDVIIQPMVNECNPSGKLGMDRRGIYDMQFKWIVWEYIRQINPEYVFIVTNQDINPDTEEAWLYTKMIDYVTASLAKYLRIPSERCKCFTKLGRNRNCFTKPNTGLLTQALKSYPEISDKIRREEIIMIGSQSGGPGQSDIDYQTAVNFGIDYIPVDQINLYY